MSRNNMTRWIENAEARHFVRNAMADRGRVVTETHSLHLGETIIKLPFSLTEIGAHALAYIRRPLSHKHD